MCIRDSIEVVVYFSEEPSIAFEQLFSEFLATDVWHCFPSARLYRFAVGSSDICQESPTIEGVENWKHNLSASLASKSPERQTPTSCCNVYILNRKIEYSVLTKNVWERLYVAPLMEPCKYICVPLTTVPAPFDDDIIFALETSEWTNVAWNWILSFPSPNKSSRSYEKNCVNLVAYQIFQCISLQKDVLTLEHGSSGSVVKQSFSDWSKHFTHVS